MKRRRLLLLLLPALLLALSGCQAVKPYQRVYLNDREMRMEDGAGAEFENYVGSIREGSTTAGGSKTTGGCGCN